MNIGILYPSTELPSDPSTVREFARSVETMGYDYVVAGDHLLAASHDREPRPWGPYDETDAFYDPLMLLSHMAATVDRLTFATGVLVLPQRQTALVARQVADLAILSDHRFRLGVGVGWNKVEYDALGQAFTTRGRRANEQIEMLRSLWEGSVVTIEGTTEVVDRACLNPGPGRQIPIWVGGTGEAAYRRAAAHGDGFMFAGQVGTAEREIVEVRRHLAGNGRNHDDFGFELVLIPGFPKGSSTKWPRDRPSFLERTAEATARWREAGGTHVTVFSTWMGLDGLAGHLGYAEKALAEASGA